MFSEVEGERDITVGPSVSPPLEDRECSGLCCSIRQVLCGHRAGDTGGAGEQTPLQAGVPEGGSPCPGQRPPRSTCTAVGGFCLVLRRVITAQASTKGPTEAPGAQAC